MPFDGDIASNLLLIKAFLDPIKQFHRTTWEYLLLLNTDDGAAAGRSRTCYLDFLLIKIRQCDVSMTLG
jgi:hypothetical protein